MKAAIYARYSSDLQKDRSIDDQIAQAKQIAVRHGYDVAEVFTDRAKSGASMFERDGLLALMNAGKRREFQAVITESLSRLSRDQEDTAAIYKRLKFNEIKIIDTSGEVTDVHIGVGGIVNSMFLKNLAVSVKRAKDGRVREGLVPGRIAFGYRGTGKPGEREIDPEQAVIVRRIFEEYTTGKSMRDITLGLTEDKVATPGLVGSEMLRNQIYIGKLVWNEKASIKNPDTGRRIYRATAIADRITVDVPHLRIIPQELWDLTQTTLAARRRGSGQSGGFGPRRFLVSTDQLLAGLLTCGACGGAMIAGQTNPDGSPRMVCTYGHRRLNCTHYRSYSLKTLQTTVLDGVKRNLTDREALLRMTKDYHSRWAEKQKADKGQRETTQALLTRVSVQMDRIVTAISDTDEPVEALVAKLKTLRLEQASLKEKLRLIEAEGNVVTLHPAAIERFAADMERMHVALSGDMSGEQAAHFRAGFRNVFERIVVHPTARCQPYEVSVYARLAAIMGFEMFPKMRSVDEMLAEQGGSPITTTDNSRRCIPQDRNSEGGIIALGKWRQAA